MVEDAIPTGKALRQAAPRSSHAGWLPASGRPSPVDVVTSQNSDRLPWLIPIRHWRMATSPFAFYRGAAKLMASDLAPTPTTGVLAQICGDAHLSNFGFYGSPERELVFDLNDFDETLPGPWEWDVKRLAASFAIAARHAGLGRDAEFGLAGISVRSYREAMQRLANTSYLGIWYSRITDADIVEVFGEKASKKQLKRFRKTVSKARGKDSRHALGRLADETADGFRIIPQPPLIVPLRSLEEVAQPGEIQTVLDEAFGAYLESVPDHLEVLLRRFSFVDAAVKVVGVGSVGTRCFIILLEGRDASDPLLLQVKQATSSVLEEHMPPSQYPTAGQRVVEGQRLMQAVSDIFLGWSQVDSTGHQYYWRQLKDMKGSADVEDMDRDGMDRYARLCGWTLARAHARSSDPEVIASYLGESTKFDSAVGQFAVAYADQNDKDYNEFASAIRNGEIEAHP